LKACCRRYWQRPPSLTNALLVAVAKTADRVVLIEDTRDDPFASILLD